MAGKTKRRGLGRGADVLFPDYNSEAKKEQKKEIDKTPSGEESSVKKTPVETTEEKSPYQMVRLSKVEPDKSQPRKQFDEESLNELAESIRQNGLLEPILVVANKSRYTIVAGERRWRACRLAGLKEIPVIVREFTTERQQMEASLIENIQRENLNPIEEANAYKRLIDEFGLTQEEVASTVQKSRVTVTNAIRLLKLDEYVQNLVITGKIDMGHARALLALDDAQKQKELADLVVSKKLSVREIEKIIAAQKKDKKPTKRDPELEAIYEQMALRMNESLGMKVKIQSKGKSKGKVEIEFTSQDDFEKIMDRIMIQDGQ